MSIRKFFRAICGRKTQRELKRHRAMIWRSQVIASIRQVESELISDGVGTTMFEPAARWFRARGFTIEQAARVNNFRAWRVKFTRGKQ